MAEKSGPRLVRRWVQSVDERGRTCLVGKWELDAPAAGQHPHAKPAAA